MQRNLRTAAGQFRENFDGEMIRAVLSLQVGPATALEGTSERYTDRYETWLNTSAHPQVVAAVLLVDADAGRLRLRRWNPDTHTFEATDWPAALERLARTIRPGAVRLHGRTSAEPAWALPRRGLDHRDAAAEPRQPPVAGAGSADSHSRVRLHDHSAEHGVHPRANAARARGASFHSHRRRRLPGLGDGLGRSDEGALSNRIPVPRSSVRTPMRPRDSWAAWIQRSSLLGLRVLTTATAINGVVFGRASTNGRMNWDRGETIRSADGCCSSSIKADRSKRLWPPRVAGIWESASACCCCSR